MKRVITVVASLAFLFSLALPVEGRADGRPITESELPAEARTMLKSHFAQDPVQRVIYDSDWDDMVYEVRLASGAKIEFSKNGTWIQVDCSPQAVPNALLPSAVLEQVKRDYPDHRILKVERDRRGYELELSGEIDLQFNAAGKLIGYDD